MKKLNVVALAASSILVLGSVVACGNENKGGATGGDKLIVSSPIEHHPFMKKLATKFNEARKADGKSTVEFEWRAIGEGETENKIPDWRDGPDVFAFASDKIQGINTAGALNELPEESQLHVTTTMSENVIDFAKFGNKMLAYPFSADNTYFIYYDKSQITAEQVKSVESIIDVATQKNKKFSFNLETPFYGIGAMFSYGARYKYNFDEEGQITGTTADFNTEKGVKAAKAIKKIISSDVWTGTEVCPGMSEQDYDKEHENDENPAAPYANAIATVSGSWSASTYKKILKDNFACAKLPTITVDGDATPTNLHSFLGGKLYGVNNKKPAKTVLLGHEFARFITNQESQQARFNELNVTPTNKTLFNSSEVQNNEMVKAVKAQTPYTVAQTAVPGNIWSAYPDLYNLLKTENPNAEELNAALKAFNDKVAGVQDAE